MPTVADFMDREPAAVSPEDGIKDVIEVLQTHDLPGVPVVDETRTVVGIITDSDLVISDEKSDFHLPHYVNIMGGLVFLGSTRHFEERAKKAFANTAAEMMTPDPITVRPDDPVERAAKLISDSTHNRLPVVDDEGRLAGVITRVDVLAALTGD